MPTESILHPSIITSCSPWLLSELAYDVRQTHGPDIAFDVFIPRHGHFLESGVPSEVTPTELMANPDYVSFVVNRLIQRATDCRVWEKKEERDLGPIQLGAFATYFPDLCSRDPGRRLRTIKAIQNTLRIGLHLHRASNPNLQMPLVCVEIVCGALLKRFPRNEADAVSPWVVEYDRSVKLNWLEESLRTVIHGTDDSSLFGEKVPGVREEFESKGVKFVMALEFEPGASYVFGLHYETMSNDLFHDLKIILSKPDLKDYVGINLDIAHFRIANILPDDIKNAGLTEYIVHSHICDHPPGMHTRDLPLGYWTPLGRDSAFAGYIDLLRERTQLSSNRPFTKIVALELEGCHHPQWIHRSIPMLRSLLLPPPPPGVA